MVAAYKLDASTNLYAKYAEGFKSGGFNALPLAPDNLEFKAERATSYEIGGKTRLMGGSMNISASAFSTDFDNLQISSFQNNSFVILNAAAARSRGFEVDSRWSDAESMMATLRGAGFSYFTKFGRGHHYDVLAHRSAQWQPALAKA